MNIPFSHQNESIIFYDSLQKFIAKENTKRMSAYLSTENTFILHHGNSFGSTADNESNLTKHSVDIEFEYHDIRLYNIEQMSSQMTSSYIQPNRIPLMLQK